MLKGSIHINTAGHNQKGSALILVIVLTVLLAAVGVLFLMTARIDEMSTSGIVRTRELRAGVNVVLDRIRTVLTDDLFGVNDDLMLNGPGDSDDPCWVGDEDEYWDYPGDDDPWLASLEPVYDLGNTLYEWIHITDLYGDNFGISDPTFFDHEGTGVSVSAFDLLAEIIGENDSVSYVENATDTIDWGNPADADGDGVADSRWIALPDITSSGGQNIYAAVRIIDNCGMININTAYRDPTGANPFLHPTEGLIPSDWDGSLLSHIDLEGIRAATEPCDVTFVQNERYGNITPQPTTEYANDYLYELQVSRQLLNPVPGYLPFDIGDELELRNRYFLTSPVVNRFGYEDSLGNPHGWPVTFDPGTGKVGKRIPYVPGDDIGDWFDKATSPTDPSDPFLCNRRHISTTYSFDRVIIPWADISNMPDAMLDAWNNWTNWNDPDPDTWSYRPVSINESNPDLLAAAIWLGLSDRAAVPTRFGSDYDREILAWQFAVNLIDYQDDDDDIPKHHRVTLDNGHVVNFFGIENAEAIKRDTSFISEIGYIDRTGDPPPPPDIKYFAIELINPDSTPKDLTANDYSILLNGAPLVPSLSAEIGPTWNANEIIILTNDFDDVATAFGSSFNNSGGPTIVEVVGLSLAANDRIVLLKHDWPIVIAPPANMPVDVVDVPDMFMSSPQLRARNTSISSTDMLLRNVWTDTTTDPGTLGDPPPLAAPGTDHVQLRTTPHRPLVNLGQIEKAFAVGYYHNITAGEYHTLFEQIENSNSETENGFDMKSYGRIRLADPNFHGLMNYLTYFEPFNDGVDNDGDLSTDEDDELQVAGRININTAPWYVIKQLPWLGRQNDAITDSDNLARAIAAWRDKLDLSPDGGPDYTNRQAATGIIARLISEEPGFRNIGELMQVINTGMTAPDFDIRKYLDGSNNGNLVTPTPPDYSGDSITDDFEERNILFHRVSNLVTVRSDVFTAYILVRIGQNGPQKRMIAIFDRSNVFSPADRPRLVALHHVPDPR